MILLWLVVVVVALAPALLMLWYIRRVDEFQPEPWGNIGVAFFAGILSVIPAYLLELRFGHSGNTFWDTVFLSFIGVALIEEMSKGTLAFLLTWRYPEFDEVTDGMVYFGVAHMGFAVAENLRYVLGAGGVAEGLMTAIVRTTTAVPFHVIVGMIMGYHMGRFRFARRLVDRVKHLAQAVLLPVLLHGLYDLAAFNRQVDVTNIGSLLRAGFGTAALYGVIVAVWLLLLPRVREAQAASPFRPKNWPVLVPAPDPCTRCGAIFPIGANYCQSCAASVVEQGGA